MLATIVAIAITLFVGVTLIVVLLTSRRSAVSARLIEVSQVDREVVIQRGFGLDETLLKVSGVVTRLRKIVGMSEDTDTAKRLALAGYRKGEHVDLFFGAKFLAPIAGGLLATFLIHDNQLFWVAGLIAIGFFAPDFWLTSAVSRRREAIRLALPDALDLLVICMEAGLGLDQALIKVGEELKISHRELSEEFLFINLEQRAGRPRLEAWRHMADRTNLEVVRSFISMLVQTERFGTPISKSLGNFADALRTRRRQQAEEMAAKTTVKMIFPLVLFIFPSLFIVLLAPAMISISKSLGEAFK